MKDLLYLLQSAFSKYMFFPLLHSDFFHDIRNHSVIDCIIITEHSRPQSMRRSHEWHTKQLLLNCCLQGIQDLHIKILFLEDSPEDSKNGIGTFKKTYIKSWPTKNRVNCQLLSVIPKLTCFYSPSLYLPSPSKVTQAPRPIGGIPRPIPGVLEVPTETIGIQTASTIHSFVLSRICDD